MNTYHVSITATIHVFADLEVLAGSENDALNLAHLQARAGGVEWSEGDLDIGEVWIERDADFYPTQTIIAQEDKPMSNTTRLQHALTERQAQQQRILASSLEENLRELARRPHLAQSLPAAIRDLDADRTPSPYSPEEQVRAAIALIRIRSLQD